MSENVKVITVHQPFASLIVAGFKDVENRSWGTEYRGPLYIHAGKTEFPYPAYLVPLLADFEATGGTRFYKPAGPEEEAPLIPIREFSEDEKKQEDFIIRCYAEGDGPPLSAIVGVVDLVDVVKGSRSRWAEPGCFHWILANPREFAKPVLMVKGKLGLWNFPEDKIPR